MRGLHPKDLGRACARGARRAGAAWLVVCLGLGIGPSAARAAETPRAPQVQPTRHAGSPTPGAGGWPLGEFLLIDKAGNRIEGSGGTLTLDGLRGTTAEDGTPRDIRKEDIQALYLKEGTRAGPLALSGAIAGLLLSSSIVLGTRIRDPRFFDKPFASNGALELMSGCTLAGALIGFLIGMGQTTWRVDPFASPKKQYALRLSVAL